MVIASDTVVDDGMIIEAESAIEPTKNSTVVVHTRSRKQDLASLSSDEHSSDLPPVTKKFKVEETETSSPDTLLTSTPLAGRSTRSAASKIADSMDEDSADQSKESDSEKGGRKSRQNRPTRNSSKESEVVNSGDDDSSPTRKSARIARK